MAHALQSGLRNGGLRRGGLRAGFEGGSIFNIASLDLNFAKYKNIGSLVTFTRASSGTFVGSDGVLQTAATDAPRFDHNPTTGESLGLLVEEARTNSVVNSNSMTAVVTGSPGTLPTGYSAQGNTGGWTREVIGSGSIGALNYVDIRFSGTPTGSQFSVIFQAQGVVAASNGQSWSTSVYHQLVGGAISNIGCYAAANLWTSLNAFITSLSLTPSSFNPTSTLQRFTGSGTISAVGTASINWGITFTNTPGSTYDFTIRFAGPQLELGAFPTSYIPTTTAAATRSADVASITGTAFSSWYRQDEGTVFMGYLPIGLRTSYPLSIDDGTTNNFIGFGFDSSGNRFGRIDTGGVTQVSITQGLALVGSESKGAMAFAANNVAVSFSGTVPTADTSATIPTVDRARLHALGGSTAFVFTGTIRRLTYWPTRLANNILQSITQ